MIEANRAAGRRVAVAESCTGGLVAAALTEIAGSSDVFEAGFVTYSNEAKIELLGVSEEMIETFGSVSVAVAWAMAQGALSRSRRRRRGGADRHRRPRRRHRTRKPVGTVVFARAERDADPDEIVADTQGVRRSRPRRRPPSGGAVRARAAAAGIAGAVERVRARSSNAPIIRRSARSNICPAIASKIRLRNAKSTQKSTSVPPCPRARTSSCCGDI